MKRDPVSNPRTPAPPAPAFAARAVAGLLVLIALNTAPRPVSGAAATTPAPGESASGAASSPQPLPASGQTRSYPAHTGQGGNDPAAVPDDGAVQAGVPLRYRDNEDGTITDLSTGLMWEKKCAGCSGLHDQNGRYHWSGNGEVETIWDWLAKVNAEGGGFAGHTDWRIPNVKELFSIVDFGAFGPAAAEAFNATGCEKGCDTLSSSQCSCTAASLYWTSTTFSDFPAHALVVHFGFGFVDDRVKTKWYQVRAVRGVAAAGAED